MAGLTFGGARKKEIADVSQIQQLIDTDPQIQAILRQPSSFGSIGNKDQQVRQILEARGLSIPEGYQISPTGRVEAQQGFWEGFGQYGVPALVGTYAGTQAFAGSGAGSGAASGAGETGTSVGTIADPSIGAAGVPNSIAAGGASGGGATGGAAAAGTNQAATQTTAAASSPSLWHMIAATAPPVVANIIGAKMQSDAQQAATEAQAKANAEALAFLKQKYGQTQQQVAPYIASGQGALSALDTGLGITPTPPQGAGAQLPPLNTTIPVPASGKGVTINWQNPTAASTTAAAPVAPVTSAAPAMNLASLAQTAQTASGVQPARVGEQRLINGQTATWDGKGWSV